MSGCSGSCTISGFMTAPEARAKSRNDKVIYAEICAIEAAILNEANSCGGNSAYGVTIAGQSPITSTNAVTAIDVVFAGKDYIIGTAEAVVISVNGLGADMAVAVSASGSVANIVPVNGGTSYAVGDIITVTHPSGATGTPVIAEVHEVSAGVITSVTISDGGDGYLATPRVEIVEPVGSTGGGGGFRGTVILDPSDNSISEIVVTSGGSKYGSNATAVIIGAVEPITGQLAVISTSVNGDMFSSSVDSVHYYRVWAGLETDKAVSLQLDAIQKYFIGLGYNFQMQVNPATMETLQYQITW